MAIKARNCSILFQGDIRSALLRMKEISMVGLSHFNIKPAELREALDFLSAGTADGSEGWVRPVVGRRYALADGVGGGNDAFRDVMAQTGGARGKLVIVT